MSTTIIITKPETVFCDAPLVVEAFVKDITYIEVNNIGFASIT
jgi:hypothetical protein